MIFPRECLDKYWIQQIDGLICIDDIVIFPEKNVRKVTQSLSELKIYIGRSAIVMGLMQKRLKVVVI
jgi:hypothetical protein